MPVASRCEPGRAQAEREVPRAQLLCEPAEPMEELLLRDQVFPVRGIRLRRLAEELRPDEAGHHIRQHRARQAAVGVHVPLRVVRATGPAHGAGVWDVAPAEALLLLLLGLRPVLLKFPPGPPG